MQGPEKKIPLVVFGHAFTEVLTGVLKRACSKIWQATTTGEIESASHDPSDACYKFVLTGAHQRKRLSSGPKQRPCGA